jgi:hypothetical protein
MSPDDSLVSAGWCFAEPGKVYAVYLPVGGTTQLNLTEGIYTVRWYNPRTGGELRNASITEVTGPGAVALGNPPDEDDRDWVVLCRNRDVPLAETE